MRENSPPAPRRSSVRRGLAVVTLATLALLANGGPGPARAESGAAAGAGPGAGIYAGLFAGIGRADGRAIDVDGFSNTGKPGWTVDYDDAGSVVGALVGRRFELGGAALRLELDGAFGVGLSAETRRIDPRFQPPDETVVSKFRWVATARAGIEQPVGRATLFAAAGLAAARIENSLTDRDAYRDENGEWVLLPNGRAAQRMDPDDSFRDGSTEIGWVIGAGVEASLTDAWVLRLDGSYLDFGDTTHYANRSGDDRCCGAGTPRRPVSYRIENRLGIARLALIRRFGGP